MDRKGRIMTDQARLRIAVQKSGRLAGPSLDLLERCGIKFNKSKDQLFCQSKNFPADLLMLRDDDIPELVNEGACDLGIVGLNVFTEKVIEHKRRDRPFAIERLADLGFGHCRLAVAVPKGEGFETLADLEGRKIATSYPETLQTWLDENHIGATVVEMSGAIEIAPRLQIADIICDLVQTGETLAANGLREMRTVAQSQSILVRRVHDMPPEKEEMIARLMRRIAGVMKAEESKYIMLHCPVAALERVKAAMPGVEAPTVLPLQGVTDKVAVHAVCRENLFWETMEDLKSAGASAILVLPIEKILD
jgi:ATP phosphoribosyltransferase